MGLLVGIRHILAGLVPVHPWRHGKLWRQPGVRQESPGHHEIGGYELGGSGGYGLIGEGQVRGALGAGTRRTRAGGFGFAQV